MVEILEDKDDRLRRGESLEERPPCPEKLIARGATFETEQVQHGGSDPDALRLVRNMLLEHGDDGRTRNPLVVGLMKPGTPSDHLPECPEGDPFPIGGTPTVVPPDRLDEPVDVLEELPCKTRLADAGRSDDAHQTRSAFSARRVEQVLQLPQLLVPSDEWSLERFGTADATTLSDDPDRPPRRQRRDLAFEGEVIDWFEGDGLAGGPNCRLAHEHRRWWRDALQPARSVDQVARDHSLIAGTQGHRRLARQHSD